MLNANTLIKCLFEGLAVAAAAYILAKGQMTLSAVGILAISVAVTFCILDHFTPKVGKAARTGSGFGIGMKQVGGRGRRQRGRGQRGGGSDNSFENSAQDCCGHRPFDLKPEIMSELDLAPAASDVGACSMKPYTTQAQHAEAYAQHLIEQRESGAQPDSDPMVAMTPTSTPAGTCFQSPYRVVPGRFSDATIVAGYNEAVVPYERD